MSRRTRIALVAAVAALSLAVVAAPASAGKNGPNNANAKKCQSYLDWVRADGSAFQSSDECTAYAAKGGALVPPLAGRAACPPSLGSFEVGTGNVLWTCTATLDLTEDELLTLFAACETDIAGRLGEIELQDNRIVTCWLFSPS